MTPADQARWNARQKLRAARDELRAAIRTGADHAIPHHRADEELRDLVEEVIRDKDGDTTEAEHSLNARFCRMRPTGVAAEWTAGVRCAVCQPNDG